MIVAMIPDVEGENGNEWVTVQDSFFERLFVSPNSVEIVLPEGWSIHLIDNDGSESYDETIESMQLAPEASEEGYLNTITLNSQQMLSVWGTNPTISGIYFYFTSPLGYGKGAITSMQGYAEEREVGIGIRFYLQPDGTRNTQTPPHQ